jgi:hypothetical protein
MRNVGSNLASPLRAATAAAFIALLLACAKPATQFEAVAPVRAERVRTQGVLQVKSVTFTGDMKDRTTDLFNPLMLGFRQQNTSLDLVDKVAESGYFDGDISLTIDAHASMKWTSYSKTIPLLSVYTTGMGARTNLDYKWQAKVSFALKDPAGAVVGEGTFDLTGQDRYVPANQYAVMVSGAAGSVHAYPNDVSRATVGDQLLTVAGLELAKRMGADPLKSYLARREGLRYGLVIKTYVAFLAQKKRLGEERSAAREQRLKDMEVTFTQGSDPKAIRSGSVMVLAIGVGTYQSPDIPSLKYPARDCRRIVAFFKEKYKLSDDWAVALVDEQATAVKISRFLTQNASKLLDRDDTLILYFGGHGAPDVDASSQEGDGLKKYLLLNDSDLSALPMTALSLNSLASQLEKLPCKRVVFILDSCFSGAAGVKTLASLKGVRLSEGSYKSLTNLSGSGRVILAASSENQVSFEDDKLQAGVFTHFLLEGLGGSADPQGQGHVDILNLYQYLAREVGAFTNKRQTPVFRGSLDFNIVF